MAIEIERKFRLLTSPAQWDWRVLNATAWEIRQAYITPPGATPEVRIRESRMVTLESAFEPVTQPADGPNGAVVVRRLAVKADIPTSTEGGVSRHEIEPELSEHEFVALWETTEGRRLRKVRVEYMADLPDGGPRVITVDLFQDQLFGLMLGEIEFGDWKSSVEFDPPGFLGYEVTHDKRYRNATLAVADTPPPLDDTHSSVDDL
jgi:CYTH domain-containing protein